jgi:hypothetical protein
LVIGDSTQAPPPRACVECLYCTFAVTDALADSVNVQLRRLLPLLEQAPDQMASRPLLTVSVIDVPVVNEAAPVAPTATSIPDGVEVTRWPLRPLAVTVRVAVPGEAAGFTVSDAERLVPPALPVIVTDVGAVTGCVDSAKVALVAPAVTVIEEGTVAAALPLASVTTVPPAGAAAESVAVPVAPLPAVTLVGPIDSDDSVGAVPAAACGVKRRTVDHDPAVPAALRARTRHHTRCAGSVPSVTCDVVTVGFATYGELMVEELSTCTS